jgi:hypothetical protein
MFHAVISRETSYKMRVRKRENIEARSVEEGKGMSARRKSLAGQVSEM